MKKSTYALIGFLAFTMIASIAAACIIIHMSLSGDKVDRVEKSTETIGLTGKNVEFGTDNCSEIDFDDNYFDYYGNGKLTIDVVFDAGIQTPRIYMDSLWAEDVRQEVSDGELKISNGSNFDESGSDLDIKIVKGKNGKEERVGYVTVYTLDPDAYVFATVVLPAELGTLRQIDAKNFDIRVYGSLPSGFKINGSNFEFCGNYNLSTLTKH